MGPDVKRGSVKVRRELKRTPHPHVLHVVGVRGRFGGDISIALEVCYARNFDGALEMKPPGFEFQKGPCLAMMRDDGR